ncbi:MAG: hypothetical protein HOI95_28730 [Chromatiales bacterium]|nr:hypothetical protein [Chromatiales bacterium]
MGTKKKSMPISGRVTISDFEVAIEAACDGFGIVGAPLQLVQRHYADGTLQRVLPHVHAGRGATWLVHSGRGQLTAAVQGLADHLAKHLPARLNARATGENDQ